MKRLILRTIRRLFLLAIFIMALCGIAISTQTGSRLVLRGVAKIIPGKLYYSQFIGCLTSEFTFKEVSYQSKEIIFSAEDAHVVWSVWSLFNKKLLLNDVSAKEVKLIIHSSKKDTETNNNKLDLAWLQAINIQHAHLVNATLYQDAQQIVQINELNWQGLGEAGHAFLFDSNKGQLTGTIDIDRDHDILRWRANIVAKKINTALINLKLASDINFTVQSYGEWDHGFKSFIFHMADLRGSFQQYPLSGFGDIHYEQGELNVKKSQIKLGNATLNLVGKFKDRWDFSWRLVIPNLDTLIPGGRGALSSEGFITGKMNQPKIAAQLAADNIILPNLKIAKLRGNLMSKITKTSKLTLQLVADKINSNDYVIPHIKLSADAYYQGEHLDGNFNLSLAEGNTFVGNVSLPHCKSLTNSQQPMIGKITINLAHLEQILITTPDVDKLRGKLSGEINLAGRINAPTLTGTLALSEGQANIKSVKALLSEINGQGELHFPQQPLQFSGHFKVGSGNGQFRGNYDLADPAFPLNLTITGKDLQVVNLNEYKVIATPDLSLLYKEDELVINGSVFIPSATINPKDFSETVTLPTEVEFVDSKEKQQSIPTNLKMNIKVKLGESISLSYRNLKAKLAGELAINQPPGSPATAIGSLYTTEGSYKAYDNLLTIQNGRLIYSGNELSNPGLDIRAAKEINTLEFSGKSNFDDNETIKAAYTGSKKLTVGILVGGNMAKPLISFFSKPSGLSQNDILSYLVFGYPQSEISKGSSLALLNSLASEMDIGGGTNQVDKLKKTLGLTEFGVGSTDVYDPEKQTTGKATMVTMGKKIGRKLYIRYSVGVLDSVQKLNLKYQLSKRLSIQSETSGSENGADILYEFERD